MASIDTGDADRDAHLRADDLLDVAKRPTMTFRSTRIAGAGEEWTLEGELTIGEVTRPIVFDVEFGGVVEVPAGVPLHGSRHAGFEATGEFRRGDFGLGFAPGLLGDVVKVTLEVQFVEPE